MHLLRKYLDVAIPVTPQQCHVFGGGMGAVDGSGGYLFAFSPFELVRGLTRQEPRDPTIAPMVVVREPRKSWSSSTADLLSMS